MKNRILFFLCVLLFSATYSLAQTNVYHPLVDSGNVWYTADVNSNIYMGELYEYYVINQVGGDTIINNIKYKKLMVGEFNIDDPNDSISGYNPMVFSGAAIRDDTTNRKVFIYGDAFAAYPDSDELLYDFNLKLGDTIPNSGIPDSFGGARIVSIDSILMYDNTYRKRWGIQTYLSFQDTPLLKPDTTYLIEGIGCTEGFYNNGFWGVYGEEGISEWLSCFSAIDNTLYESSFPALFYNDTVSSKNCQIVSGIYNPSKVSAQLFPNPVTRGGSITIKGITEDYTLTIDNILGQQVFWQQITFPDQPIALPGLLTSGVYLCHIKTQSNLSFIKKIVVL